jgi:hypothetical protein
MVPKKKKFIHVKSINNRRKLTGRKTKGKCFKSGKLPRTKK